MLESLTQTSQLYERLRSAIITLELLPGESLAERGLESRFQASRTPVRAALVRLEPEGLVRRNGRGFIVAPIDLDEIASLAEYREAIETAAVRLAVERATDAQLDLLAADLRTERREHDPDAPAGESVRHGGSFHTRLAELSGNGFLAGAVADALRRLERTRHLEARSAESREHAHDEHASIVQAVRARDAELASTLVARHIRGTHDRLREALAASDWRRTAALR
ncbi:GntR family transcriptional regulator [Agreia sp. COWG]|uniref:GntR family transcriptional regulator n=1 Tax=Agreia sp. COWG TaxID=2773266 RepID=UPI0019293336|nr:GntR family transcriptional regulator [Agreia sp. COWG]CAD6007454.1 Transcriptional regulator, GntR family [Agreia sp. COWG]